MKLDILLGLQWGDEGKGKVVDYLAPRYDVVARFQGGPNAGHTLEFDGIKHVLHQIPSGIFRSDILNIIGNGVVLDPVVFKKEIEGLAKYHLDLYNNLYVSKKAQLILPTHRLLDAAYEKSKGHDKIGSTLKGIGPAYQDKIARLGLRVGDITLNTFRQKYDKLVKSHLRILEFYGEEGISAGLEEDFFEAVAFLKKFDPVESEYLINAKIASGAKVLAEGAQGSLLDIDFGSYPFVTSSNTTSAGVCSGLGVAPGKVGEVIGIFKAYCTRVGSGPFPTELFDRSGEEMQQVGNEFGATTGRSRRCGWLDLPALRYATMINGATQLYMMKVDVLNAFEEIKICTGYKLSSGKTTDIMPFEIADEKLEPVYRTVKGWNCSLEKVKTFKDLPPELLSYIEIIESATQVPVNLISTGPDRKQTIMK